MKEKYKDQDDEDRQLMQQILQVNYFTITFFFQVVLVCFTFVGNRSFRVVICWELYGYTSGLSLLEILPSL